MKSAMKSFRYLSSFFAGMTVGAGLALLVTPMSGRKMKRQVSRLSDRFMEKANDLKDAACRIAC